MGKNLKKRERNSFLTPLDVRGFNLILGWLGFLEKAMKYLGKLLLGGILITLIAGVILFGILFDEILGG